MKPRARIVVAVLAALAIAMIVYVARAWPWLASPDAARTEQAWKVVREAAVTPPAPVSSEQKYRALLDATSAARSTIATLDREDHPRREESWPENVRETLDKLVAWAEASEGSTTPSCERARVIDLVALAKVAFRAQPDERRAVAFVRLSARLRRAGNLLEHRVGLSILEHALRWASAREGLPSNAFRELRADVTELRGAFARDAMCIDEAVTGAAGLEDMTRVGEGEIPWIARRFARPARERAMLRLFTGERLAACTAEDGRAFAECMQKRAGTAVPSLLVRMADVAAPDISETLALQRAVLARAF